MKVFSRLENMPRLQVLQRTYLNGFDEHWTDKTSCVLLNLKKSNLKISAVHKSLLDVQT